ncbi:unnamed protein product, partial [Laminaria digitata]
MSEGARTVSSADTQTSVGDVNVTLELAAEMTAAPGWEKSSPANHNNSSSGTTSSNAKNGANHHGRSGNTTNGNTTNGNTTNGNTTNGNGTTTASGGGRRPGAAASTLARTTTDPTDDASPRECRIGNDDGSTFDPKGRVPLKIGAIGSGSRLSGSSGGLGSLLACVSGSAPGTPAAEGAPGVVVATRGGEER